MGRNSRKAEAIEFKFLSSHMAFSRSHWIVVRIFPPAKSTNGNDSFCLMFYNVTLDKLETKAS